jgi:DNA-binding beta-propeller fold protein YncE
MSRKPMAFALAILLPVLLCMTPGTIRAAEGRAEPLVLERTISLPGVSGRIDHMAVDLGRKHLFVAELGNGTVDAIDLTTGDTVHRIAGLKEPQGIGYAPAADLIAVASAGDGSVRMFWAGDFSSVGTINLGEDADNVRLDTLSGRLVVGYGSGGLAVLDPVSRSVTGRMKLPAHPEGFRLDPATRRAFVNVPDARQIAVVDLSTGKQVATWRVTDLRANFPMAFDETGAVLATVFRSPARLVLLDAQSGSVRQSLPTCGDADDVFFDSTRRRIYVSCGEGVVDVLQQEPAGYRQLGRIRTASGARTSLFVPELDRLFVAVRAGFFGLGSDAAILILRPQP